MAEWDRLLPRHVLARVVAAPVQGGERPSHKTEHEHCAENTQSRQSICTVMKDLGHSTMSPVWTPLRPPTSLKFYLLASQAQQQLTSCTLGRGFTTRYVLIKTYRGNHARFRSNS